MKIDYRFALKKNNSRKNNKLIKITSLFVTLILLLETIFSAAVISVLADTYYNVRINYYFADGTPARDAYVATYPAGADVNLTVTNPTIDGFVPMTATEGGDSALTTTFNITSISASETADVYYIAGLTHYRALYYKQNLYDDLYTRDNTLPSTLTDRYGLTGSNPTDLEDIEFEGFTNLFHEPDAIAADGSTVFRVYYDRKEFSLKFFYARQNYANGQLTNNYSLTNSTKNFSKYDYYGQNQSYLMALNQGSWQSGVADSLPHVKDEYLKENGGILEEKYVDYVESGSLKYRYYYYEIQAKYNEPLRGKWFIDAITPVHKKDFSESEICVPGSWATEYGTNFMLNNRAKDQSGNPLPGKDNFTIKGIYEKLGDELMFRNRSQNYTNLNFLLSWTNTNTTSSGNWNYGFKRVLHFRYENYTELLPNEIELAQHSENGYQALVDNGTYLDVIERTFKDLKGNSVTRVYGLEEKIESKRLIPAISMIVRNIPKHK